MIIKERVKFDGKWVSVEREATPEEVAEYEASVAEAANDEGTLEEQLADLQAQNAALLAYLNLLMTKDSGNGEYEVIKDTEV